LDLWCREEKGKRKKKRRGFRICVGSLVVCGLCHVTPVIDVPKLHSSVSGTDGRSSVKFVGTDEFKTTDESLLFTCSVYYVYKYGDD
jgi:hypothetical protein